MLLTAPSVLSLSHVLTKRRKRGKEKETPSGKERKGGGPSRGLSLEGAAGPPKGRKPTARTKAPVALFPKIKGETQEESDETNKLVGINLKGKNPLVIRNYGPLE